MTVNTFRINSSEKWPKGPFLVFLGAWVLLRDGYKSQLSARKPPIIHIFIFHLFVISSHYYAGNNSEMMKKKILISSWKVVLKNTVIPIAVEEEEKAVMSYNVMIKSCSRPTQEF